MSYLHIVFTVHNHSRWQVPSTSQLPFLHHSLSSTQYSCTLYEPEEIYCCFLRLIISKVMSISFANHFHSLMCQRPNSNTQNICQSIINAVNYDGGIAKELRYTAFCFFFKATVLYLNSHCKSQSLFTCLDINLALKHVHYRYNNIPELPILQLISSNHDFSSHPFPSL